MHGTSESTGRIRYSIPPYPEVGSKPRAAATTEMRIRPIQNAGTDCPMRAIATQAAIERLVPAHRRQDAERYSETERNYKACTHQLEGRRNCSHH